jgi:SPFH domain/Band 7 family protein
MSISAAAARHYAGGRWRLRRPGRAGCHGGGERRPRTGSGPCLQTRDWWKLAAPHDRSARPASGVARDRRAWHDSSGAGPALQAVSALSGARDLPTTRSLLGRARFAPRRHCRRDGRRHGRLCDRCGAARAARGTGAVGAGAQAVRACRDVRLGRVTGDARGPGLVVFLPLVECLHRVSLRIVTMPIQSQGIITRDNVSVDVSTVAYSRVADPVRSVVAIENVSAAINQIAQNRLRHLRTELTAMRVAPRSRCCLEPSAAAQANLPVDRSAHASSLLAEGALSLVAARPVCS